MALVRDFSVSLSLGGSRVLTSPSSTMIFAHSLGRSSSLGFCNPEDCQRFLDRVVCGLAGVVVGKEVLKAADHQNAANGTCPRRHRMVDTFVQRLPRHVPSLDHPPQLRFDLFPMLWQEVQLRITDGGFLVMYSPSWCQVNQQRPVDEVRAELAIVGVDRDDESVVEMNGLARTG